MQTLLEKELEAERFTMHGVPEGYDAWVLARLAREVAPAGKTVVHIALDDMHLARLEEAVAFFDHDVDVVSFPAWDCLPYDRVSPNGEVTGARIEALSRLISSDLPETGRIVLTTVNAAVQRVPPRAAFEGASFTARRGDRIDMNKLTGFLADNGYHRAETVREPGEFAVRGGLIDVYPSGAEEPLRLDLFGDEIEEIRSFDALSQRTTRNAELLSLRPVAEIFLDEESIRRFRSRYRELFGVVRDGDPLYDAIGEGNRHAGMEHWLPLFYETLETLFDYLPYAVVTLGAQAEQARSERLEQVEDFYNARHDLMETQEKMQGAVYKPVPVDHLYLDTVEWHARLADYTVIDFAPFAPPSGQADGGGRRGRDFGDVRAQQDANVYDAVREHIAEQHDRGRRVLVAAYSTGARDRLKTVLGEHGIKNVEAAGSWETAHTQQKRNVALVVLGADRGFTGPDFAVITEQDILGDRLARPQRKKRKSDNFIQEISALGEGDYVVHEEHGIGQFAGLESLVVNDVPHDCLKIIYSGGDKLFVPVENIEVLSRYGSEEAGAQLDKLGGVGWQARKARARKDLMEMADELLKIAAARVLRRAHKMDVPHTVYEEFCARFPYPETDDQLRSINDVLGDLDIEHAMDRLVCGDVGFGKTEVALRAAFVAAMSGYQVAVIAPTTLLCRQHYNTFVERFRGFPIRIGQLSRLVSAKDAKTTRDELVDGTVNIVIGTHSLLGDKIKFNNLGLLVVDEEQRFGVKQKEKLKALRENVHVLTLTATPIPRTLQMALAGVRELSLIATPPVDRLAVRTFVLPHDPVVIREALMREHYRGGQSFYVCPRISDLAEVEEELRKLVPELKLISAHGQMAPTDIEDRMTAFYDGAYDVLLSTNIVESGLDITNANTMILHRAEMFGLAQLYQLRGRVGRSRVRAYAYLTYNPDKKLTKNAEQRLHAIEQLDTLGAGFQLASHDLDIRGAGNLLGEEQSGHIREIGVELYQQMLEEAVAAARSGTTLEEVEERWSPQIKLGMPVLIPENYIKDLNVRLNLYRRIATLETREDIDAFAVELADRFGELPGEVENLLQIVAIKQLCRRAGVAEVEAGPKGVVVTFRPGHPADIAKLVAYIGEQAGTVKLRPDEKLVCIRAWDDTAQRLRGVRKLMEELVALNPGDEETS